MSTWNGDGGMRRLPCLPASSPSAARPGARHDLPETRRCRRVGWYAGEGEHEMGRWRG